MKFLIDYVSECYRDFGFGKAFNFRVPNEFLSNCSNCHMVKAQGNVKPYSSKTKCCTWYPFIPNYLAGAMLVEEESNEALKRLNYELQNNSRVTPFGIFPSPEFLKKFMTKKVIDFGRAEDCKCPFYSAVTGGCTIWKYRSAICSTFFCSSIGNKEGERFWGKVTQYLDGLQDSLINIALIGLGESLLAQDYEKYKNELKGRREIHMYENSNISDYGDFYRKCYLTLLKKPKRSLEDLAQNSLLEELKNEGKALFDNALLDIKPIVEDNNNDVEITLSNNHKIFLQNAMVKKINEGETGEDYLDLTLCINSYQKK